MISEAKRLYPGIKKQDSLKIKYFFPMIILLAPAVLRWIVSILIRSDKLPSKRYLEIVFVSIGVQIQVAYIYFLLQIPNISWQYYENLGNVLFVYSLCLVAIIFAICEFVAYFNLYDIQLKEKEFRTIEPTNVSLLPAIFSILFSLIIIERIWHFKI